MSEMKSNFITVEVIVEYVKTLFEYKNINVKAEFAKKISFYIDEIKNADPDYPQLPQNRGKNNKNCRRVKNIGDNDCEKCKIKDPLSLLLPHLPVKSGGVCLFQPNFNLLISDMRSHPIVISFCSGNNSVGSSRVIWHPSFIEFLEKISFSDQQMPLERSIRDQYKIIEDQTSKVIGIVIIEVKLSCIKDESNSFIRRNIFYNRENYTMAKNNSLANNDAVLTRRSCDFDLKERDESTVDDKSPLIKCLDTNKTKDFYGTKASLSNTHTVGYYQVMNKSMDSKPASKTTFVCKKEREFIFPDTNNQIVGNKVINCKTSYFTFRQKIERFLINQNHNKESHICNCIKELLVLKTKTTYCSICGGYEIFGDDLKSAPLCSYPVPPCPVFHQLKNEQNKTNSENNECLLTSNHCVEVIANMVQQEINMQENDTWTVDQTILNMTKDEQRAREPISDIKPRGKKKKSRFTLTNGYKAPIKTHEQCQASKRNVPKHMGWLWNEDIPGLKYRPEWRPGAVSRRLNRLYKQVRNSQYLHARKKKKVKPKKVKRIPKPTVIITKKDGEYEIQMEILKSFSTERLIHQYPYEDAEPLIYKVGRTDQENVKRKWKMERKERRRIRRNNKYLQQTFRDTCKEVCLKAYKQAIGELPIPDPNNSDCPCFPENPIFINLYNDSCSCSDSSSTYSDSECDDDWMIQFTPPAGTFHPDVNRRPHFRDNHTQYSYLDYKVKICDKNGKPLKVPRFFIGPDGKQVCSDLGGFMGPDGKWLVIGRDGTIGPDGRWIPLGCYDANGKWVEFGGDSVYIDEHGNKYTVGVDGYINQEGKWVKYPEKGKDDILKDKPSILKVEAMQSLIYMPKIISSSMCPRQSLPISCMQQTMSCDSQAFGAWHPSWAFGTGGTC